MQLRYSEWFVIHKKCKSNEVQWVLVDVQRSLTMPYHQRRPKRYVSFFDLHKIKLNQWTEWTIVWRNYKCAAYFNKSKVRETQKRKYPKPHAAVQLIFFSFLFFVLPLPWRYERSWAYIVRQVEFGYGVNRNWNETRKLPCSSFVLFNDRQKQHLIIFLSTMYAGTLYNSRLVQLYTRVHHHLFEIPSCSFESWVGLMCTHMHLPLQHSCSHSNSQ